MSPSPKSVKTVIAARPFRLVVAGLAFGATVTALFFWLTQGESRTRSRDKLAVPASSSSGDSSSTSSAFSYEILGDAPLFSPPQNSPAATPGEGSTYTIEIAAPTQQSAADALLDRLKTKGIDAYYTPLFDGGRVVYRVRHGIYQAERDAAKAALTLSQRAEMPAKAVKLR